MPNMNAIDTRKCIHDIVFSDACSDCNPDTGEIAMTSDEEAVVIDAVRKFIGIPSSCSGCNAPLLLQFTPTERHTLVYCAPCLAILDAQESE